MLLGIFAAAAGIVCMAMRTSVPTWAYAVLAIAALPTAACELRAALRRRWQRAVDPIDVQIMQRTSDLGDTWRHRGDQQAEIAHICSIVGSGMGWHGDRFLPHDPLVIVLWNHESLHSAAMTLTRVEEKFGLDIFRLAERIRSGLRENQQATFDDFIGWIFEERDKTAQEDPQSSRS